MNQNKNETALCWQRRSADKVSIVIYHYRTPNPFTRVRFKLVWTNQWNRLGQLFANVSQTLMTQQQALFDPMNMHDLLIVYTQVTQWPLCAYCLGKAHLKSLPQIDRICELCKRARTRTRTRFVQLLSHFDIPPLLMTTLPVNLLCKLFVMALIKNQSL